MNLNKQFVDKLSLMKFCTVGGVIEKIGLVSRTSRGNIIGLTKKAEDIMQIFYTVDYLISNKFVELVETESSDQPDFVQNLMIDIFDKRNQEIRELENPQNEIFSYVVSMPSFIEKYWGMKLLVRPSYFKMIQNGYKTDLEKKEIRNYRLSIWFPVLVAVLVSFLTTLFSYFFNNREVF